jgi:hypothetical protein
MSLQQFLRIVTGKARQPEPEPIAIPWPRYPQGYADLGRDLAPWQALVNAASAQQSPSQLQR